MPKRSFNATRGASTFKRARSAMQPNIQKAVRVSAAEMKNFSVFHNYYQPAANGDITSLVEIATGAGEHQRVGNQIRAQYMRYRIKSFGNPHCVVKQGHSQRFVLIRWKGTSVPTVTDILDDGSGALWAGAPPQTPYNVNKRHMFDVLMDRLILLGTGNTTEGVSTGLPAQRFHEGTVSLKGGAVNYDGISTTGPQNGLYLLRIGSDLANSSYYEGVFQTFYTD